MLILPQSLKPLLLVACCLTVLLISASKTSAQDHLAPEWDSFGLRNEYNEKIRQLFEEGFRQGVILRVLILESFTTESLVGIRKTSDGVEAFISAPRVRSEIQKC